MSSGSRSCCRRSDPLSFHGSVFGSFAAVRILGRFRDPQPAALVPVDVHGLVDQGLGRDERQIELRVHLDLRGSLGWSGRSPFDVAQVVAELVLRQELVDVRALAGPGDPAQENRAVVRSIEILVEVPGDRNERAIRRLAAVHGALVGPHLRLHVVDAHALAAAGELLGPFLGGWHCGQAASACRRQPESWPRAGCPCRSRSRRPSPSWTRPW